ncbi:MULTISPECIES: phage holin family protein [unclassified Fusobacterium]|uniref:phage holin family protein n=1 Tax=unclassified Fusobacterium TaxID=2648384 RepID=UPI001B8C6B5E|nr:MULTISPECIES: phage holin family protein [unclassified Fusobacterium]MBR8701490.1 hypothetical protein [Fusobacterium sp. DD45]MBR8711731.1 hypothetical protein [Fusobacterium sp. DD28]MBR8752280.1 hypothetical protein [Fusobacterium sp. DD26]
MIQFDLLYSCKSGIAIIYTSWLGLIAFLIGGFDILVSTLVLLMLIDYITGIICGYKTATLNSKRAYRGIKKKVMVLCILCGATLMNRLIPGVGIRDLVGIFYCATELLSIIENAEKIGVPIPEQLRKALEQCKKK